MSLPFSLVEIHNPKNIPLRECQIKAIQIAHFFPRYAFYFDTGVGKTRTACSIIFKDLNEHFGNRFWLVVTPKTVIPSWIRELQLWDLPFYTIVKDLLKEKEYFNLLNGERMSAYLQRWEKKEKKILILNPEILIRTSLNNVDGLVVDESSIMQYPFSKQTKALLKLSESVDKVYLFSGSPAPNDPIYLWAQAKAIGATQNTWHYWAKKYGEQDRYWKWYSNQKTKPLIFESMKDHCWYLSKKEVLTLQEPTVIIKEFSSPTNGRPILRELENKSSKEIKNELMKLRTLSSGFAYEEEFDEEDEKKVINTKSIFYDNCRLEMLEEVLEEYGNKKLIIWYQFIYSREKIKKMLKDKKIPYTEVPEEFIASEEKRIFLSHPRSCGKGVDGLQTVCSDMIFYEISFSYDEYYQAVSRLHRSGQENPVVINILINKWKIDEYVWKALEKKANFLEFLITQFSKSV